VDEMFKQKGKHIVIRVGEPISLEVLEGMESPRERCEFVREKVYQMAPKK
jgi:hypothetical protein